MTLFWVSVVHSFLIMYSHQHTEWWNVCAVHPRTQTAHILQVCRGSRAPGSLPAASAAPGPLSWEWHRDTTLARSAVSHWWVSHQKTEEEQTQGGQGREHDRTDRNEELMMEKAGDSVMKLTDEEPNTDLGERIIPAMECLRVSSFDTLSLLLSWK